MSGRKLGEGTFGIVKEVKHKETGEVWACKAVNKEKVWHNALLLTNMIPQINIFSAFVYPEDSKVQCACVILF